MTRNQFVLKIWVKNWEFYVPRFYISFFSSILIKFVIKVCSSAFLMFLRTHSFMYMQYDALITELQNKRSDMYKDADDITKESKRRLSKSIAKICYCLDDVGLVWASEVFVIFIGFSYLCYSCSRAPRRCLRFPHRCQVHPQAAPLPRLTPHGWADRVAR